MGTEIVPEDKTLNNRALVFIKANPGITTDDLMRALGKTRNHISVIVANLKSDKKIKSVGWGKYYAITDDNNQSELLFKSRIETRPFNPHNPLGTKEQFSINQGNFQQVNLPLGENNFLDLEKPETWAKLKEKYGREKLINILKQWQKILE